MTMTMKLLSLVQYKVVPILGWLTVVRQANFKQLFDNIERAQKIVWDSVVAGTHSDSISENLAGIILRALCVGLPGEEVHGEAVVA